MFSISKLRQRVRKRRADRVQWLERGAKREAKRYKAQARRLSRDQSKVEVLRQQWLNKIAELENYHAQMTSIHSEYAENAAEINKRAGRLTDSRLSTERLGRQIYKSKVLTLSEMRQ